MVVRCTPSNNHPLAVFGTDSAGKDRSMAALKLLMPSIGVIDFHNLVDSHHRRRFRCC